MSFRMALCLSGHYRTFDLTFPSIKAYLMEPYGICEDDVYIHTWSNDGFRLDLAESLSPSPFANAKYSDGLVDSERFSRLNLKNVVIDDYKEVEKRELFRETVAPMKQEFLRRNLGNKRMIGWSVAQYYKRFRCLEMLLNSGKTYDLVVSTRLDFSPKHYPEGCRGAPGEVDLSTLLPLSDTVYLTPLGVDNPDYHDFYIIGKPEVVLECCKLWQDLDKVDKLFKTTNYNNMSCGHATLTQYIRNIKKLKILNIDLLGYIERGQRHEHHQ